MSIFIPLEVILLAVAVTAAVAGVISRQIEAIIIAILAVCITAIYTIGVHYDLPGWWGATVVAAVIFAKFLRDNLKFNKH